MSSILIMAFDCSHCDKSFTKRWNRTRHEFRIHGVETQSIPCYFCHEVFTDLAVMRQHAVNHVPNTRFTLLEDFFEKVICTYTYTPTKIQDNVAELIRNLRRDVNSVLKFELLRNTCMKAAIVFHLGFIKDVTNENGAYDRIEHCVRLAYAEIDHLSELRAFVANSVKNVEKRILDFVESGSGWILEEIQRIDLCTLRCPPLSGSCNLLSVEAVSDLRNLHPAAGLTKLDCFQRCIALAFVGDEDPKSLEHFIRTRFDYGQEGAITIKKIALFEKRNPGLDLSINVIFYDGKESYPVYRSKNNGTNSINLLLFQKMIKDELVGHYLWIKDVDKFLRKSYRGESGNLSYQKGQRCPNCLSFFYYNRGLKAHSLLCNEFKTQKVIVPNKEDKLQFDRKTKCIKVPIVIFFDFEAVNKKTEKCSSCSQDSCVHRTVSIAEQVPSCYSIIAVSREGELLWQETYSGYDAAEHFVTSLLKMESEFLQHIKQNLDMVWTNENEDSFNETDECHICRKTIENGEKVRDHDHLTGEFIGAAHNSCNFARREVCKIPVYCHNFEGYDSHFIVHAIPKGEEIWKIEALPSNGERLKTLTINNYHFVDTFDFLQGSLNNLVASLPPTHPFKILDQSQLYKQEDKKLKNLLLKKGVYCYEWATSLEKLQKTKKIPPIGSFFSHLSNKELSLEEYNHALEVFADMKCENMLDYTLSYCLLDTHLLAEVFFRFREEIQKETELDCW